VEGVPPPKYTVLRGPDKLEEAISRTRADT
jgi:hypothetical protein